jgi:hypothetical protein
MKMKYWWRHRPLLIPPLAGQLVSRSDSVEVSPSLSLSLSLQYSAGPLGPEEKGPKRVCAVLVTAESLRLSVMVVAFLERILVNLSPSTVSARSIIFGLAFCLTVGGNVVIDPVLC